MTSLLNFMKNNKFAQKLFVGVTQTVRNKNPDYFIGRRVGITSIQNTFYYLKKTP
jgi:hypothetical protein